MDDDSHQNKQNKINKSLKSEWSLLVDNFLEDEVQQNANSDILLKIEGLSLDFINEKIKDLSQQKQLIFKKIEKIKKDIEEINHVIENLHLVGSDTKEYDKKIDQLHATGEKLTQELSEIDFKLKKIRSIEQMVR